MKTTDVAGNTGRDDSGGQVHDRRGRKDRTQTLIREKSSGSRAHSAFADYLRRVEDRGVRNVQSMTGKDISDRRPENLRVVDDVLTERFRATVRKRDEIEGYSMAFGMYLGEVFVRNLGGLWHFPSWLQAVKASVSRNRHSAERYCYILVGEEKVYVFRAARQAIEETGTAFSLYEFYSRYTQGISASQREDA